MPTRLLREGILSSARIDKLSAEAEVFYRRLMSKVDDHGLFDARTSILRSGLYPLNPDRLSEHTCEQLLTELINAKLIIIYQIDEKPFLKMLNTKWPARSEPKYPPPVSNCLQLKATVSLDVVVDVVRSRLIEVVDVVVENRGDARTEKPTYSSASQALEAIMKKRAQKTPPQTAPAIDEQSTQLDDNEPF